MKDKIHILADALFHIGPCQSREDWDMKVLPLLATFATECKLEPLNELVERYRPKVKGYNLG